MTPLDTNQSLTLNRKALGWGYMVVAILMVAMGAAIFWLGLEPGEIIVGVSAVVCIALGIGTGVAVGVTRRRAGEPFLMLAPEGITFALMSDEAVPWAEVIGLKSLEVRGQASLIVQVTDTAHQRVVTSRAMQKLAKADDVLMGAKGLTIWHNQIDTPLDELAGLIAQYAAAHGGPDLRRAA